MPLTSANRIVLTPIPTPIVATESIVTPGARRSTRIA